MSTLDVCSTWRRSSHSGNGGNCVEVAGLAGHGAQIRDSKDPEGPRLSLTAADWRALARRAKSI
ncbi:DUF397 domain-containing protein [Spirillospora sp. NPDC052269]